MDACDGQQVYATCESRGGTVDARRARVRSEPRDDNDGAEHDAIFRG